MPQKDSPQRILGIDPGLRISGYAILEIRPAVPGPVRGSRAQNRLKIVEAGIIRVPAKLPMEQRLREIKRSIDELLSERRPQVMALEQLYAHYQRTQPAILMGHARGVLMLASAEHQVPVVSYAATAVKKAITGHGRAPKDQIQGAVCRYLGLSAPPEPPDVADALAIALCHVFLQSTEPTTQAGKPTANDH